MPYLFTFFYNKLWFLICFFSFNFISFVTIIFLINSLVVRVLLVHLWWELLKLLLLWWILLRLLEVHAIIDTNLWWLLLEGNLLLRIINILHLLEGLLLLRILVLYRNLLNLSYHLVGKVLWLGHLETHWNIWIRLLIQALITLYCDLWSWLIDKLPCLDLLQYISEFFEWDVSTSIGIKNNKGYINILLLKAWVNLQ